MTQPAIVPRVRFALSESRPLIGWHHRFAPGTPSDWDMHYELELLLVLDGRMRVLEPGRHLDLRAGQLWFGGVWEAHGWELSHAVEIVLLIFSPSLLATQRFAEAPDVNWLAAFRVPPAQRPQWPSAQRPALLDLGRRLAALLDAGDRASPLRLRLLLLELLALVYEHWQPPRALRTVPTTAYERLQRAVQCVLDSHRLVTAEAAAALCGLSRNAFNEQFTALFGLSFAKFGLRHRLSCAAADLLHTDQPLKAIARKWGFADESHLDHRFREAYGVTPARYRRKSSGRTI